MLKTIIGLFVLANLNLFANDLYTTKVPYTSAATKEDIKEANKLLFKALRLEEDSRQYAKLIKLASDKLSRKSGVKEYKAAIVAEEYGERENLADFRSYLEGADEICFNGNIDDAYEVAMAISDDIWIYDEYGLDEIVKRDDHISFRVMDLFTFSDVGASEDDKENFITEYNAYACE